MMGVLIAIVGILQPAPAKTVFMLVVYALNVLMTQISYNFVALPVIGKFVWLPVSAVLIGVLAGVAMGDILLAFLVVPILSTLTIIGGFC
jgi:hypothetical protein